MDLPGILGAIRRTGFAGWLILETKPVGDDAIADARYNARTVRQWLAR
jgi:hypothetical protein